MVRVLTMYKILRRYDIAFDNPAQPVKVRDPLVWITSDFWIRFTRRGK